MKEKVVNCNHDREFSTLDNDKCKIIIDQYRLLILYVIPQKCYQVSHMVSPQRRQAAIFDAQIKIFS